MKELSTEVRVLLAFVLSMLAVWAFGHLRPPKKAEPAATPPAVSSPSPASTAGSQPPAPVVTSAPTAAPKQAAAPVSIAATEEQTIVVENDLYRVELSNRGGVVRSWQLKKYKDSGKPAGTLDVVHREASQQMGNWPLAIELGDPQLAETEKQINAALFRADAVGEPLRAPVTLTFEWSDGRLSVTKKVQFDHDYIVAINTSVLEEGKPLAHSIGWRGGFGDATVYNPAEQVTVFYRQAGKLTALAYKNLGKPDKQSEAVRYDGTAEYAGIQDRYFAAAFLPRGTGLAFWHRRLDREVTESGKTTKIPVAEVAAGSTVAGPIALQLIVGPKDLDVLGRQQPPMTELVDFGWLTLIAKPLFLLLRWIHDLSWVQNYGWAIILMTIVLNMAMYPLKVKSYRSMQRMQKLNPDIQAIRARYAKYTIRDPRKQQESKEIWALYKKEKASPAGGCLPMLIQMPIWLALYTMLAAAIELRHAPWIFWIRDLSERDPYYILPVLMGVTMFLMQKMTPMTATDPAQQQMMNLMPIMFGVMFVILPVSSGLVLYILTSNVVGIGQQWHLNRTAPATASDGGKSRKGKKA